MDRDELEIEEILEEATRGDFFGVERFLEVVNHMIDHDRYRLSARWLEYRNDLRRFVDQLNLINIVNNLPAINLNEAEGACSICNMSDSSDNLSQEEQKTNDEEDCMNKPKQMKLEPEQDKMKQEKFCGEMSIMDDEKPSTSSGYASSNNSCWYKRRIVHYSDDESSESENFDLKKQKMSVSCNEDDEDLFT